jgi:hypothetical protein
VLVGCGIAALAEMRDQTRRKRGIPDDKKWPIFGIERVPDIEDIFSRRKILPFCMRRVHDHLRAERHLYHDERFYMLGPFMLDAGHKPEAINDYLFSVFSQDASRPMNRRAFNNLYSWDVSAGPSKKKQKEYSPNCIKTLIPQKSGRDRQNGEAHGCPFAYLDRTSLDAALASEKDISAAARNRIVHLAYDMAGGAVDRARSACRAFFDATNGPFEGDMWRSPSYYTRWALGMRSNKVSGVKARKTE